MNASAPQPPKLLDRVRHACRVRHQGSRHLFPVVVHPRLRDQLDTVRLQHEKDVRAGFGRVYLPHAMDRKLPAAASEFRWQYVFQSANCRLTIGAIEAPTPRA